MLREPTTTVVEYSASGTRRAVSPPRLLTFASKNRQTTKQRHLTREQQWANGEARPTSRGVDDRHQDPGSGAPIGDEYRFVIPQYQRPYAWTTDESGEMFDDSLAAVNAEPSPTEAGSQFLGNVVLVKAGNGTNSEVVDGQQRPTTLILLLALRLRVDPAFASSLELRLFQKGKPITSMNESAPSIRNRSRRKRRSAASATSCTTHWRSSPGPPISL